MVATENHLAHAVTTVAVVLAVAPVMVRAMIPTATLLKRKRNAPLTCNTSCATAVLRKERNVRPVRPSVPRKRAKADQEPLAVRVKIVDATDSARTVTVVLILNVTRSLAVTNALRARVGAATATAQERNAQANVLPAMTSVTTTISLNVVSTAANIVARAMLNKKISVKTYYIGCVLCNTPFVFSGLGGAETQKGT